MKKRFNFVIQFDSHTKKQKNYLLCERSESLIVCINDSICKPIWRICEFGNCVGSI